MTGFRWLSGAKLVGQIFAWVITIIVIRLLSPEDYGLMAMAMIFVNFLMLLNELGLGAVLIQSETLDKEEVRQIFGVILLLNTLFFIILYTLAPWFGGFFGEERLIPIIQVLSLQFLIGAFEVIPVSMLERELDYKKKSLAYLVASMSGGLMTLYLALEGHGVWSLVWGSMTSLVLKTIGINLVSPYIQMPKFSFKGMRRTVSFGGLVTIERALWFFYTQADVLIIGKLLGKELLGLYSVAMHLSSLVMHKIGGIVNDVVFPTFSRVQGEPDKIALYFIKAVRVMSFFVFPMFLGMASISSELVGVLLGEKWQSIGIILSILVLIMPLRMISNLLPPALQGVGRADTSVFNLALAMVIMPLAFIGGSQWGLIGVSLSWLIVFPIVFFIMISRSVKYLCVSLKDVFVAMLPPAICSLSMAIIIIALKNMHEFEVSSIPGLIFYVLVGAISYLLLALAIQKPRCHEVVALMRR